MNLPGLLLKAERDAKKLFEQIDDLVFVNQARVLDVFRQARVRDFHFNSSTGYGYNDAGRDLLEEIYAGVFKGEAAVVRSQIVSGTHAISLCLFALLGPGDELLAATGRPYDTLVRVIGGDGVRRGTLTGRGVVYRELPLTPGGRVDIEQLGKTVGESTRVVLVQRSRGYSSRPALLVDDIAEVVRTVKNANPHAVCLVDNCYGEFTARREPTWVGADLIAGSLIKNPGGGLAPSGGYVVGRRELVEQVAEQLTAPGLGREVGASLWDNRLVYQGLFLAPHVVGEALKGAVLTASLMERLGYEVSPRWDEPRGDIVQEVRLGSAERVQAFCQVIQSCSPVDSDLSLEFAPMPGYREPIIMAAGTFVQGSSIELSCDAPRREPFAAYLQGGLTYQHVRYALAKMLEVLP
ncbi:MAG: hypothetical protein GXX09_06240 [Syntrophomonadaceae bacterium]|nr:hypothetical protein [Syntrophomonadaceae bacterium]